MKLLLVLLLWGIAWATPRVPADSVGFFDASVLQIEEAKYLGNSVALDVVFTAENGKTYKLGEFLKEKPTALVLAYYTCDSACPLVVKGALQATKELNRDYNLLILSFDKYDNLESLKKFKAQISDAFPKTWTFGIMDEENINKLTSSVGYKFFYSRQDRIFVHPNVIIFISPSGKITRYLYGVSPSKTDMYIALAEAEEMRITKNALVDLAFLACYRYDPKSGKYVTNPVLYVAIAGFVLVGSTVAYAILKHKKEVIP